MRTAGIDLATKPERTAACTIDWEGRTATVHLVRDRKDSSLIDLCRNSDKTGIDCPFGWPQPFVEALHAHAAGLAWPGRYQSEGTFRTQLAWRETDRQVRERTGCTPLSVAADRLGLTAMRCALLLDDLGDVDRTGVTGPVAEVYPAASLVTWGLPRTGYKRTHGRGRLIEMLVELLRLAPALTMDDETYAELQTNDDAFDAVVCALTARAVVDGRTHHPTPEHARLASAEGWIHVPVDAHPPLVEP